MKVGSQTSWGLSCIALVESCNLVAYNPPAVFSSKVLVSIALQHLVIQEELVEETKIGLNHHIEPPYAYIEVTLQNVHVEVFHDRGYR